MIARMEPSTEPPHSQADQTNPVVPDGAGMSDSPAALEVNGGPSETE